MADAEAFNRPPRVRDAQIDAFTESFQEDKAKWYASKRTMKDIEKWKAAKQEFHDARTKWRKAQDKKAGVA